MKSFFIIIIFKAIPTLQSASGNTFVNCFERNSSFFLPAYVLLYYRSSLHILVRFWNKLYSWNAWQARWHCDGLLMVLQQRLIALQLVYCYRTSSLSWMDHQPLCSSQLMKQLSIMSLTFDYLFWNQYCSVLEPAACLLGIFIVFTAYLKALSASAW